MPNYHLRIQSAFPSLAQEMQAYLESVLSGNLFVLDEKMVRSPSTSPGEIVGSGYLQAKFSGIQANTKKEVHKVDPEQIALLANDILKINARLWMDVIFLKAFRAEFYRDKNARPAIYQNFLQHLLHMHLYIDEEPNIIIQYVNGLIHDYTFLSGKSDILMQWKEWLVAELYAASDTALQKQLGICNSLCSNIQMLDEEEKIILLKKLIFLMQNLQEENLACPIFEIYQFLSPKLKKALVKALKKLQEEKNENAKLTITNIIHHDTCDHGANGFELASMLMGQSAKLDAKFNVLYQDIMSHRISAAFTRIMENFAHFAEQNGELELVDDPYIQS